jgi:hypothetical protein
VEIVDVAGAPPVTTTTITPTPSPTTTITRPAPVSTPTTVPPPAPVQRRLRHRRGPARAPIPPPPPPAPPARLRHVACTAGRHAATTTAADDSAPAAGPAEEPRVRPLLTERLAQQTCDRARTRWRMPPPKRATHRQRSPAPRREHLPVSRASSRAGRSSRIWNGPATITESATDRTGPWRVPNVPRRLSRPRRRARARAAPTYAPNFGPTEVQVKFSSSPSRRRCRSRRCPCCSSGR